MTSQEVRFRENAYAMRHFITRNGCRPRKSAADPVEARLADWLTNQLTARRNDTMSPERRAVLDTILDLPTSRGAVPEPLRPPANAARWRERADAVRSYCASAGHRPRARDIDESVRALAHWLKTQRSAMRLARLHPELASELIRLEAELAPLPHPRKGKPFIRSEARDTWEDECWDRAMDDLGAFLADQDREPSHVAVDPEERRLGHWLRRQRRYLQHGTLREDRIARLNELGDWTTGRRRIAFDARFEPLRRHVETTGRWPRRDAVDEHEHAMAAWLDHRLKAITGGSQVSPHVVAAITGLADAAGLPLHLEQVARSTTGWDLQWRANVEEYATFVREHDRLPSKQAADDHERTLGWWWQRASTRLKRGVLTEERIAVLRAHGLLTPAHDRDAG